MVTTVIISNTLVQMYSLHATKLSEQVAVRVRKLYADCGWEFFLLEYFSYQMMPPAAAP